MHSLHVVPDWREDETLYSWSARMHRVLGGTVRETGFALFGIGHAYKEWTANGRLGYLCSVTDGHLGGIRSILVRHTVVAAYLPFLRVEQRLAFERRVGGAQATAWITQFGMRASNFDGCELRWCDCCVREDIFKWGLARWRLSHQLPGAWFCLDHNALLQSLEPGTAAWPLPISSNPPTLPKHGSEVHRALQVLSALAVGLVGIEQIDLVAMRLALLARLRDIGLLANMKPLSAACLRAWFEETQTAKAIQIVRPSLWERLPEKWIYQILLMRRASHPLLWIMLWAAAFEGQSPGEIVKGFQQPVSTRSWQEDGQGLLWVDQGFCVDSRVQAIVLNANSIQEAARQLKVSITTVRRYMSEAQCSPKQAHVAIRRESRRDSARAEIEKLLMEKADLTKSDVHILAKAAVSWLRRWDSELLDSLMARIPESRSKQSEFQFDSDGQ